MGEETKNNTCEFVKVWKIRYGKHKDKSYGEVVEEEPDYLKWAYFNVEKHPKIKAYLGQALNLYPES